jgi:hypothetical protein
MKKEHRTSLRVTPKEKRRIGSDVQENVLYANSFVTTKIAKGGPLKKTAYVFTTEPPSGGFGVAVLPFKRTGDKKEFLLQKRVIPPWSLEPQLMALQGDHRADTKSFYKDMTQLLKEKTGYITRDDNVTYLGTTYVYTRSDKMVHLFAVDLTHDTPLEKGISTTEWVDKVESNDPLVPMMMARLAHESGEDEPVEVVGDAVLKHKKTLINIGIIGGLAFLVMLVILWTSWAISKTIQIWSSLL